MQRWTALIAFAIVFIFFVLIAYFGALITLWSSIVLALFLSLIILVIYYPPSQIPSDIADYTLVIYAIVIIIGMFLLGVYIIEHAICDVRIRHCV